LALLAAVALIGSSAAPAAAGPSSCQQTRHLVLIDARTGAIDCASPDPSGPVTASVADENGGWYIAGAFTRVGSVAQPMVAHLDAEGNLEPGFHVAALVRGAFVVTLALHGNVLYVGWKSSVAALDARTGKQLWRTPVGRVDPSISGCCAGVNAIAYGNGVLYVVGVYKLIGGVPRHDVAALDPRTGRPLRWSVDVGTPGTSWLVSRFTDGDVLAVSVVNGTVYLGGEFDHLGGRPRKELAAVSARTGRATPWAPVVRNGGSVEAMVIAGGEVIVGGDLHLAAFDLRTARRYGWTAKVQGRRRGSPFPATPFISAAAARTSSMPLATS
jgi:outer membrane protein assembly factor BamB